LFLHIYELPLLAFSEEHQPILFADIFKANFQQRFNFFGFFCYFNGELVGFRLKYGLFYVYVQLRVSYALMSKQSFNVSWILFWFS